MEVRIVRDASAEECGDADFIRVSTSSDPNDDTVTLATIQRVVHRSEAAAAAKPAHKIKTLIMKQPMSVDAAVGLATRYAERKNISVIYTHHVADEQRGDSPNA